MDFLVHIKKVALPLYPQFGLQMNIYYVPPIHVPLPFLKQMFGPGAERAVQTYRNARNEPELLGIFMLMGATDRWIDKFRVAGGFVYGYDSKGAEIVRVSLKEPVYVRPFYDAERKVYRHNIT